MHSDFVLAFALRSSQAALYIYAIPREQDNKPSFLGVANLQKPSHKDISYTYRIEKLPRRIYSIHPANMQFSSTLYLAAISLVLPTVTANPWGNPLLKARDIPTCVDGSGSGCQGGPWTDMEECEYQCYGAEKDTGDM